MDTERLQRRLQGFSDARNWDRYHTPKNLSMALSREAGELLELFQWLSEDESRKENLSGETLQLAREELADIMIYVLRFADKLGIDLEKAVEEKIILNERKYPVDLAKGNAVKYNRRES